MSKTTTGTSHKRETNMENKTETTVPATKPCECAKPSGAAKTTEGVYSCGHDTNRMVQILVSFCRWTSVRGMPHVVRSENRVLRRIWAVFVCVMCVANISLVAALFLQYYKFDTIENIKKHRNSMDPEFPSLTVCNVDPVSTDQIACLKNESMARSERCEKWATTEIRSKLNEALCLIDKIDKLSTSDNTEIINCTKNDRNLSTYNKMIIAMEDSSKISQFYQMIGMKAASHIGHQQDDFIIKELCTVTYYEAGNQRTHNCNKTNVKIEKIVDYKYFNCYTLTIDNLAISRYTRRISLVLYLDEEESLGCKKYCTHRFTEWAGGKAVIHPARTFPEIERNGMNLLTGASNQLLISESRLSVNKDVNVGKPDKRCDQDDNKKIEIFYISGNMSHGVISYSLNYTDELCIKVETQEKVMSKCKCIDAMLPLPLKFKDTIHTMQFCGNISQSEEEVTKKLACKEKVKKNDERKILEKCMVPCMEFEYFVELTQLRWPQKPEIIRNYIDKIKNRPYYARKFRQYEEIKNLSKTNPELAMIQLRNITTFENNFLQIDVNKPNFDIINYAEKEEFTLTTLLSQVGGICSIFLGFTFVTILELIELGYRLYQSYKSPNPELQQQRTKCPTADVKYMRRATSWPAKLDLLDGQEESASPWPVTTAAMRAAMTASIRERNGKFRESSFSYGVDRASFLHAAPTVISVAPNALAPPSKKLGFRL